MSKIMRRSVPVVMVSIAILSLLAACATSGSSASASTAATAAGAPRAGLVGEFLFDGEVKDAVGSRNAVAEGTTFVEDRRGRPGSAVAFDGKASVVMLGEGPGYDVFTVSLWVRPSSIQSSYANIIDDNHRDNINWVSQQNASEANSYHFGVSNREGAGVVVYYRLQPEVWQHVVLTKGPDTVAVHLNGALVESKPSKVAVNYDANAFMRLGAWGGGGRFWSGAMDDLRIYNRVLSPQEISALFSE